MSSRMLHYKSLLVGSPFELVAKRARWIIESKHRYQHPELWELHLEEIRLPQVLKKLLKPDSCCVDVGSHIGSFLTQLIKLSPRGKHTAIEASQTKGRWLQKKYPEVDVICVAVGDYNGTALFEEDIKRPGFSHLQRGSTKNASTMSYAVEVRRLDDILTGRVDFMKLDIEGGELGALRGALDIIGRFQPILLFECGSEYLQAELGFDRRALFEFVTNSLGYNVYSFPDYLYEKGPMGFDEFRKCGLYPFRAFNFIGLPVRRVQMLEL